MDDNTPEWLAALPEALHTAPHFAKAESLDDAVAKIQHASNYMARAVKLPTDDTSPDDRDAFYTKLLDAAPDILRLPPDMDDEAAVTAFNQRFGVPEEAKAYEAADVEGWEWDDDYVDTLRGVAHAAGLNSRQFARFTAELAKSGIAQEEEHSSALDGAKADLKKEWGEAYAERMTLITGWLELSEAPDELKEMVSEGNVTKDTANWLHAVSKQFTGDVKHLIDNDDSTDAGKMTPMEAEDKIQEILADPDYFNPASPRFKGLQQKMIAAQEAKLAGAA